MSHLRIEKIKDLASLVLSPDTLYLIESSDSNLLDIYVSNKEGTSYRRIANEKDILSKYITVQPNPPTLPCKTQLWWCNGNGSLYIQYEVDGIYNWVEAIPAIVIPTFAGNGVEDTMAHSDHWHEGITLSSNQW